MRDHLDQVFVQQHEDINAAIRAGIQRAAEGLREKAMSLPAPCGCAPEARCHQHCRVTVKSFAGREGVRQWAAVCNGQHTRYDLHSVKSLVWGDLLGWATRHVNDHRAMLGGPDE